MKLLVFAHIPPPYHGQSYMVKLMLERFGGDVRAPGHVPSPVECYHVDSRYSADLEDIGAFRLGKVTLVLRYCAEAIWCRFRYGVTTFYYVPAPGKRAALYRDWIVMLLCRPFFREFVHHWHAVGLGDWLEREATGIERWITHRLLGRPALGLSLAIASMRDALWFRSRQVSLVPNGIPDPCPDFERTVLPRRQARLSARRRLLAKQDLSAAERAQAGGDPEVFRVLYLAHCTREKGLFDSLDAVAIANRTLRDMSSPIRLHLTIAGEFPREDERSEFTQRVAADDLAGVVHYAGFIGGPGKTELLANSDCLCFPTYYHAESFGLVIVEAMAAGLCIVTTRRRAAPDILPPDHAGFVAPRDPADVARALVELLGEDATPLRAEFAAHFTEARHAELLSEALLTLSPAGRAA